MNLDKVLVFLILPSLFEILKTASTVITTSTTSNSKI